MLTSHLSPSSTSNRPPIFPAARCTPRSVAGVGLKPTWSDWSPPPPECSISSPQTSMSMHLPGASPPFPLPPIGATKPPRLPRHLFMATAAETVGVVLTRERRRLDHHHSRRGPPSEMPPPPLASSYLMFLSLGGIASRWPELLTSCRIPPARPRAEETEGL